MRTIRLPHVAFAGTHSLLFVADIIGMPHRNGHITPSSAAYFLTIVRVCACIDPALSISCFLHVYVLLSTLLDQTTASHVFWLLLSFLFVAVA